MPGSYLAGRNAVFEALRAGRRVRRVLVDVAARSSDPDVSRILAAAEASRIPVERIGRPRLDTIAPRHQGIVAEVEDFITRGFTPLRAGTRLPATTASYLAPTSSPTSQNYITGSVHESPSD